MRFRPRFGLRSFLLSVTVFAVWFGLQVNRTRQQAIAVAKIQELGGRVVYSFQVPNGRFDGKAEPAVPQWLWPIFGKGKVYDIDFMYEPVDDEKLSDMPSYLQLLPKFHGLYFEGSKIGDLTLERLKSLRNFELINIDRTRVTDAGLLNLKKMPNLKYLVVAFADQVTAAGVEQLADFPYLWYVTFNSDNPTITQKSWDAVHSINNRTYDLSGRKKEKSDWSYR